MDKYEGGGAIFFLRAEEDVQKERMSLSPHHQSAYCLQTSGGLVQEDGYRRASKVNRSPVLSSIGEEISVLCFTVLRYVSDEDFYHKILTTIHCVCTYRHYQHLVLAVSFTSSPPPWPLLLAISFANLCRIIIVSLVLLTCSL